MLSIRTRLDFCSSPNVHASDRFSRSSGFPKHVVQALVQLGLRGFPHSPSQRAVTRRAERTHRQQFSCIRQTRDASGTRRRHVHLHQYEVDRSGALRPIPSRASGSIFWRPHGCREHRPLQGPCNRCPVSRIVPLASHSRTLQVCRTGLLVEPLLAQQGSVQVRQPLRAESR